MHGRVHQVALDLSVHQLLKEEGELLDLKVPKESQETQ